MVDALVGMGASREIAEIYGEMSEGMAKLVWEGEPERGSITLEQRLGQLLA